MVSTLCFCVIASLGIFFLQTILVVTTEEMFIFAKPSTLYRRWVIFIITTLIHLSLHFYQVVISLKIPHQSKRYILNSIFLNVTLWNFVSLCNGGESDVLFLSPFLLLLLPLPLLLVLLQHFHFRAIIRQWFNKTWWNLSWLCTMAIPYFGIVWQWPSPWPISQGHRSTLMNLLSAS